MSSAENLSAWNEAQYVWNTVGKADPTSDYMMNTSSRSRRRLASSRSRFRPRNIALLAAGALSVYLAVLFQPAISIWLTADYSTAVAELREIDLEDGSIVHLGADSAIAVAFEPQTRRVKLLSGEAYFEVKPDKNRPFKVETGNVETTVLGTAFNVKLNSDGVGVAVSHGRVGVATLQTDQGLGAPLEAGDWVRVAWNGEVERGNDAPELVGGWRSGMLVVKDWPVSEVISEIRRHYSGTIVLTDSNFGKERITGVYDLKNPLDALRAVAQAYGVQMRQISPWVTVVSRY